MEKDINKIDYTFNITGSTIIHNSILSKDLGDPTINLERNFQLKGYLLSQDKLFH